MRPESTCSERAVPNMRGMMAVLCALLILSAGGAVCAQGSDASVATAVQDPKIPPDQLDSLVAPIALYPDPILAQVLVASTYPLELVQLQQWLEKNPKLKDKALTDAVMKQPWDASIQAMAAMPDAVKLLADDIQWTTDLGNAFLAQQSDVMDAVQRMRKKAQDKGTLKSSEQMKVETKVVEEKTVIVVESANPEVIYVPSYNPTVVYPPPVYPYPPIYYPPPPPYGYAATAAISFGVGVAVGAAWGHCGWGCGWGGNDVDIDINNNFNRNSNINNISGNRGSTNVGSGNKWQHNPQHRGGAPYSNRSTANKYGGTARGDSLSSRQSSARQQVSRQGGNLPSASNRSSGGAGGRDLSSGSRGGSPSMSDRSSGGRGGSPSVSNRSSGGSSRDSIGGRSASHGSSSRNSSAFGSSGGYSGGSARSSSSRGSSSMSRGGGSRGGGGGRGRR